VEGSIDNLRKESTDRFNKVDERFDKIDELLEKLEKNQAELQKSQEQLPSKLFWSGAKAVGALLVGLATVAAGLIAVLSYYK